MGKGHTGLSSSAEDGDSSRRSYDKGNGNGKSSRRTSRGYDGSVNSTSCGKGKSDRGFSGGKGGGAEFGMVPDVMATNVEDEDLRQWFDPGFNIIKGCMKSPVDLFAVSTRWSK